MDVVSLCPFRVQSLAWQAHTGAHALTVIVKATFLLLPGESVLAPDQDQDPVHEQDQTCDGDPRRSIFAPSDMAPFKVSPEIMLVGHAYAPHAQPARSLMARMTVGLFDKSVEVWCDRVFRLHDEQILEGPRFVKMPLGWERAAGGPDTDNPLGLRSDAAPNQYGVVAIPNLQPPGIYVTPHARTFVPVGFGPIGSWWPARVRRLGPYATSFRDPGWESSPLPADFDPRYFQAAPLDQVVEEIRPNERITLENLHPDHTRLVTTLPGLQPRAIVDRATGEREEVSLVPDTLWIDTDRGVCCVVWRGRIGLRHSAEPGRIAVWVDGLPMEAPVEEVQVEPEPEADEISAGVAETTLLGPLSPIEGRTLPFIPGPVKLPEPRDAIAADIVRWVSAMQADASGTIVAPMENPPTRALPFGPGPADTESGAKPIPPLPMAIPLAMPLAPAPHVPPIAPSPIAPPPIASSPIAPPPIASPTAPSPIAPPVPPAMPFERDRFVPEAFRAYVGPRVATPAEVTPNPAAQAHVGVAHVATIGPLATVGAARDEQSGSVAKAEQAAEASATKSEPVEAEDDGAPLSIEETAAIAAEIEAEQMDRAKVLEARSLSERVWQKNEARWSAAMDEEQGRGKSALRAAYDAAYVKRVEGFRGEITVAEYAKLAVGMERGKAAEALDALKIQRGALMPIVRVWSKKIAQDMKVGKAAIGALREARDA